MAYLRFGSTVYARRVLGGRHSISTLVLLAVFLAGLSSPARAANRYVRAGASGTADGSDWNNAYPNLPSLLTRGDVYYIADGNYPAYLFDDAVSGSQLITVKKATTTDHGSNVGWSEAYGDGQANFSAPLKFRTGYYVFDGARRSETDWFDNTSYGFRVSSSTGDYNQSIKIGGLTSSGGYDYGGTPAHGVQIRYTAVMAQVMPSYAVRSYQIDVESGSPTSGFVAHRLLVENGNNSFFLRNTSGAIVEYSAVWKAKNSSENHGEVFNLYYNANGAILRNNYIKDNYDLGYSENAQGYYAGTAVVAIVLSANVEIYGNVFDNNCVTDATIGFVRSTSGYEVPNIRIYNNTSFSRFGPNGFVLPAGSSGVAMNNLFLGGAPTWANINHDYNGTTGSTLSGEPSGQTNISSSLFRNYTSHDFRLAGATSPGTPLGAAYSSDLQGTQRGLGGWDRGAYEHGEAAPTPAAPTSVTLR